MHIQARSPDLPALKRCNERILVDNGPARGIDEDDAVLHFGELGVGDEAVGAAVEGEVDADDVRGAEQVLEGDVLSVDEVLLLGDATAIVVLNVQAEADGAPRHRRADPAHPQYAQRLALRLVREAHLAAPFACAEGGEGDVDAPQGAQDEEHGCVGAAGVDGSGGVRDGDAAGGAGVRVDGVVAGAIVGDESQGGGECRDEGLIEPTCYLAGVSSDRYCRQA